MDASPAPPQQPPPPCGAAIAGEIAFFDVETTVPSRAAGTGYALLEFGAILVCPRRLVEVGSYSTLICPTDTSAISPASVRCNGITPDTVATAPSFLDVADNVFAVLHGRVWAGHNIARFDCARIREAFAEIGRPGPEPKGLIDTLPLLTQRFGRRAGDMKMATLASYFGLGQQRHRSLDDVRMNLEVLKYCAAVLFLESNFSDMYSVNSSVYESITRNHVNGNETGTNANLDAPCDLSSTKWNLSSMESKTIFELNNMAGSSTAVPDRDPSELIPHIEQIKLDTLQTDTSMDHTSAQNVPEMFSTAVDPEGCSGFAGFLEPCQVSTQCISVCQFPFHQYGFRILLLHKDAPLQLGCTGLRVRFGTSNKFVDYAGRPKLSIVVDVPVNLSQILDVCDHLAHGSYLDSGGSSVWRPVIKKDGYSDSSTARLNIPTAANGDVGIYSTEIYHREQSGSVQKLVFSRLDPTELDSLFVQGTIVDAFFCLEAFDYQNWAGLRLVAKRLTVHSK